MSLTFAVYTLGCKVNYYESTAIAEALVKEGLIELGFSQICDIYIINTCAVTGESERKARQIIRRARNKNPDAYIVVTGCMAQISPESAFKAGADYVCGNREKMRAARAALDYARGVSGRRPERVMLLKDLEGAAFEQMTVHRSERTRAYIKIGDGCDGRCAYCIINRARGPIRSKPLSEAVKEARELVCAGYREIVLTAIEISTYGKDLENTTLLDLIEAFEEIPGLCRVRLGSLDPAMLGEKFISGISKCKKLCPHFHISLQSGCDRTLAAMRRKYNIAAVEKSISQLRAEFADASFSADVIVGFPGESEEDFLESAEFIASLELLHAHIFPFSARPGTPAYFMPNQIKKEEKDRRLAYLFSLCDLSRDRYLDRYVGKVRQVLFEENRDGYAFGHTSNFIKTAIAGQRDLHYQMRNVSFTGHCNGVMLGNIVPNDGCVI